MENGQPIVGSLYVYAPNKVAPVVFAVLFAISAVGHIWQCSAYHTWGITGLQALCAVFYVAGYALREYGAFDYIYTNPALIVYITSQVLIYICPPLLELSNYHVLARTFSYIPHLAPLPPSRTRALFGALVAGVEALNGIGVAFIANPNGTLATQQLGSHLTLASLAVQLADIIGCIVLAGIFYHRAAKSTSRGIKVVGTPLLVLCGSMACIAVRSVFRVVEYTGRTQVDVFNRAELEGLTPLLRYEWYFYVFETVPLLVNSFLWNIWNPGRYLPRNRYEHVDEEGRIVEEHGEEGRRSRVRTLGHILTFGALFGRERKVLDSSAEMSST